LRLKLSEKSYRSDFISTLRKNLHDKSLIVIEEGIIESVDGSSVEIPDVLIVKKELLQIVDDSASVKRGGIIAIVETKKPKKNAGEGLGQAVRYTISAGCKTGFTTNFRDIMGFKLGDSPELGTELYGDKVTSNTTELTANYVVDILDGTKNLLPSDRSEKAVLAVLLGAVNAIGQYMNDVEPDLLKGPLGFEAPSLNPLENRDEQKQQEERLKKEIAMKKGAAYLLVNQILFYNVLSSDKPVFPRLRTVSTTYELQKYFDKVLEHDYRPVFSAKVAPILPNRSVHDINDIIEAIQYLKLEKLKHDILGKIFHNLIPFEIRKRLAAYYTSNAAAEFLANLSIDDDNPTVIDFSCGSGTLLVAAYHAKKALSPNSSDVGTLHRKLLKEIFGIDVQLFASHLAVIHLSLQEPSIEADQVLITREDAFKLKPFQSVEFLGGAASGTRVTLNGLTDEQFVIPMADLLIQNPPFTRVGRLEDSYKKWLEKILRHRKEYLKPNMGLHCYFILHTTDFLKENGRYSAVPVRPAATFYAKYGEGIRKFLLDAYSIEYFITYASDATFSEASDFKEVLLIARKNSKQDWYAKCVVLKKFITLENFQRLADKIRSKKHDYSDNDFSLRILGKQEFAHEWNWMVFTKSITLRSVFDELIQNKFLSIGKSVFVPKEGVHMNVPKFFFLPNKEWSIEEKTKTLLRIKNIHTSKILSIPQRFLGLSLRRPEFHTKITPQLEHYLVLIPPEDNMPESINSYIEWGEENKLHRSQWVNTYCKQVGIPWYSYMYHDSKTRTAKGNIVIMMKFRIKRRTCLVHYFDEAVRGPHMYFFGSTGNLDYDKALVAWFNSTILLVILLYSISSYEKTFLV
jgi:type I restriction-modification system DNA methylase subunit